MSGVVKFITGIFSPKKPKVSKAADDAVTDEKNKARRARNVLLGTEGGIVGEELQTGQVEKRDTLLGN